MRPFQTLKFSLLLRAIGIYRHLTLGARVAVIAGGKVLAVKHGYVGGWHLPGGGVDPGESAEEAGRREVIEETGFAPGPLRLFSLYHSTLYTNRDHVALFVADQAEKIRDFTPNHEITEIAWLSIQDPPDDLSPATARRLAEIAGTAPVSPKW